MDTHNLTTFFLFFMFTHHFNNKTHCFLGKHSLLPLCGNYKQLCGNTGSGSSRVHYLLTTPLPPPSMLRATMCGESGGGEWGVLGVYIFIRPVEGTDFGGRWRVQVTGAGDGSHLCCCCQFGGKSLIDVSWGERWWERFIFKTLKTQKPTQRARKCAVPICVHMFLRDPPWTPPPLAVRPT